MDQRSTPDDRRDDDVGSVGHTLSDPNRVHVTLENLVDLAKLDTGGWSVARAEPAEPAELEDPPSLPRRHSTPQPFPPPPPFPGSRLSEDIPPSQLVQPADPEPEPEPDAETEDELWDSGELPVQPVQSAPWEDAAAGAEDHGHEDHEDHEDEVVAALAAVFETPPRARWARPAQRWLPEALALALASGAFVIPSVWLLLVAVTCVVAGSAAFVASGHPLRTLPWRALHRGVTLLHPRSSSWAPVLAARVVLVGVVVPGAIAAALWLADEGRTGIFAAARAGAWTHGFRVAGVLTCAMLLTSVGDGRLQRAEHLRRLARPLPDEALVSLVVGSLLVLTLAAVALPHPEDPVAASADGLGWLPGPARARADLVRDDVVTAELDSVSSCLSHRSSTKWQTSYTSANGVGEPDVARLLVAGSDSTSPPYDLVTALMAAHNQLAPWVEAIEVPLTADHVVRVDRSALSRHRPLVDQAELTAATTGLDVLSTGPADVTLVLRCSAGAVL